MIKNLKESMGRNQLVDAIDEIYSYDDEKVDAAISTVIGVPVEDLSDVLDDGDEYEGFYSNLTTAQLQKVYDIITDSSSSTYTLKLNSSEINVLIDAMKNYSDPHFTKDREMSLKARVILTKLQELQ